MGDVLMTTPALRALREARSDRRVTLSDLARRRGGRQRSSPGWTTDRLRGSLDEGDESAQSIPGRSSTVIDRLGRAGFDAAVIFTVYSQNPLPAALLLLPGRHPAATGSLPGESLSAADRLGPRPRAAIGSSGTRCAGSSTWWRLLVSGPMMSEWRIAVPDRARQRVETAA